MTPERIAELRALAGAATPGPWSTSSEWSVRGPDDNELLAACSYHNHAADAEYIAAACNELPVALDEIEVLRANVAWLRGIVDAARRVAFRGEHTADCIGASGGACFEDGRYECECGLTALRNVLASYTPAMVVRKAEE